MKKLLHLLLTGVLVVSLCGCVNQYPDKVPENSVGAEQRIVASSNATLWIMDKLNIDLIGRCETPGDFPERYKDLPTVGTGMSPDTEAIAMLDPTDVIGPDTLIENIKPGYEAAGIPYTFIDLQSVDGLYKSIDLISKKYGKEAEAKVLFEERDAIMEAFHKSIEGKEKPRVMVLMGLPGSYIQCTSNSYVGSLVDLAGAENVIKVEDKLNFVSWNTEELLKLDPNIILLTAHGLPDLAMEMFAKEFSTNDIWKNFTAVKNKKVYKLDYGTFGMSAAFSWDKALNDLKEILYDGSVDSYDAEGEYAKNNP